MTIIPGYLSRNGSDQTDHRLGYPLSLSASPKRDGRKKSPASCDKPGQCMWGLLEQSLRFEDEDVALVLENQFNKI